MLSATHTSVARPPARYTALARRVPQVRTRAISSIIDGYNVSIDVVLAKAGDVEAPIAVPVVIGAVVAVSLTAAIPFFLKSGQEAADEIFTPDKKFYKGKGDPSGGKRPKQVPSSKKPPPPPPKKAEPPKRKGWF